MEKVFIIQPITDKNADALKDEAVALIDSAGAAYLGVSFQTIREINPATYIGSGKLEEIRRSLDGIEDVTILFNGSISPTQTLNISEALEGRKVIDRTTLILDIFARNAVTSEGKIQVELAQLKYIYPRLKGKGEALSRLGGGIGSRGPGETQLETDRRHIRYRIKYLENKLAQTETRRALTTERRLKDNVKIISLVGYTNTGKSTLLNALTGSDVLEKDALFATLDPSARKFVIDGKQFLLIDTVGFLRELPHDIIEAFKSTLEAAVNCDLALIVSDASSDYNMQFNTALSTLKELGFDKKYIKVINKCDKISDFGAFDKDCVFISAKNKQGLDNLKAAILEALKDEFIDCNLFVKYGALPDYNKVSKYVSEKSRNYENDGIKIAASVGTAYSDLIKDYIIKD